jgi:hypothetical protein
MVVVKMNIEFERNVGARRFKLASLLG